MNAKRLLKLADFLDKLPRQKFNFNVFAHEGGKPMREALKAGKTACGTVGCAVGWTPVVFPRLMEWVKSRDDGKYLSLRHKPSEAVGGFLPASELFGISYNDLTRLFDPVGSALGYDATPKQVARHIRKYVREKQRKVAA